MGFDHSAAPGGTAFKNIRQSRAALPHIRKPITAKPHLYRRGGRPRPETLMPPMAAGRAFPRRRRVVRLKRSIQNGA